MESRYLPPPLASVEIGVEVSTLAKWRFKGNGPPYIRCGGRKILYDRADLEAWLNERKHTSTAEESVA